MSKHCSDCFVLLDVANCYAKGELKPTYCKRCLCKRQITRWIQRKKDATAYLGAKCRDCGYNKSYAALEFHHRDPREKEFVWNKLRLRNWAEILVELDKCDLLCKNCHAERHNPDSML